MPLITRRGLLRTVGIAAPAIITMRADAQFNGCPPGFCSPPVGGGACVLTPPQFTSGWTTGGTPVTFDPTTATSFITLSGGNLVVTSGTTNGDIGVKVGSADAKTSGKWYWEITLTTVDGGWHEGVGVCTFASALSTSGAQAGNVGGSVNTANIDSGEIYCNGVQVGDLSNQGNSGDVVAIACDLDHYKIWFKMKDSGGSFGNWNAISGADPTCNVDGFTLPAGAMVPFVKMGGFSGGGAVYTANFGGSAMVGTLP